MRAEISAASFSWLDRNFDYYSIMTYLYEELVDFIAAGTTSQSVADFHPSEATKTRVSELIHRQKTSGLSDEETDELNEYLHLEHLLRLAKARARQFLASA